MISVVAILTSKPGMSQEFKAILSELAVATQKETGCQQYSLEQSLDDENVFVTVEKWTSKADLDAHLQSPHVNAALSGAADMMATAPQITPCTPLNVGDPAKYAR
jgi:quinol monooxygenase YgiN